MIKVTKKLREKVSTKEFVEQRLRSFMEQERRLTQFFDFECSSFFVGQESAKVNTHIYNQKISRVRAEIRWYFKKLKELEERQYGNEDTGRENPRLPDKIL